MTKFKIENFCEQHNEEFNRYYNYLNDPIYEPIILHFLKYIHHDIIKNKIYDMIAKNHCYILDKLNKIDIIISYYQQNNLINKSEIGKFFSFYLKFIKKIDINNNDDLFKLFYKMISYEKCIIVLKECFYIFSNYRACIYFMTPTINFYNSDKNIISKVILSFKDNINTLNQIISKVYLGDINPWGSIYYSSAYSMYETLYIINKYYKDPLKELDIEFKIIKKCNKTDILKNLLINYEKSKLNGQLNINKIVNVTDFISKLKKLGYDMWFVIPIVFKTIYEKYKINKLPESNIFGYTKIYYQKMNNLIGLMVYILIDDGYITNINIFKNFND